MKPKTFSAEEIRYLELLSRNFPTIAAASTEIINLEAILSLPKGTEHFLTDIHGENEAFDHVLRNASGAVARKVDEVFGSSLREKERKQLCTLIYYPKERLEIIKREEENIDEWYAITMQRLIKVCRAVASKYTRSKVRKAMPEAFSYIIQEMMHESEDDETAGGLTRLFMPSDPSDEDLLTDEMIDDYRTAFRTFWKQGYAAFFLVAVPLGAAGFGAGFYLLRAGENLVMFAPFLVCSTIFLVALLSSGCLYGALGAGMRFGPAVRLALTLGVGRPLRPLLAALVGYGLLLFGILQLPISLIYVLALGFSLPCLLGNFFLRTLLREYCPVPEDGQEETCSQDRSCD